MSKSEAAPRAQKEKDTAIDESASTLPDAATPPAQSGMKQSCMLLKTGTAKKLGKQSEGHISYRILADSDRKSLYLSITENIGGGGYFSREIVPFAKVEACITKREQENPFPSKTFKEAFTGRSSNDPGFLCAILRASGLLAAAADAESQHVIAGDWSAWKTSLLSEAGTMIEIDAIKPGEKQVEADPVADHTERKKTLSLPRKKTP